MPQTEAPAATPYALTADEALARLEATLPAFEGETRTPRAVARIEALRTDALGAGTRSAATVPDADAPMGYVANFEGVGYAILSADSRKAPVTALARVGELTAGQLAEAYQLMRAHPERATNADYLNALIVNYLLTVPQADRVPVAATRATVSELQSPLLTTTWTQEAPYNLHCPNRCLTGFANTAIAQLLICNYLNHGKAPGGWNVVIPNRYTTTPYNPNWVLLGTTGRYGETLPNDPNSDAVKEVASFIAAIGLLNQTQFDPRNTYTDIVKIAAFLRQKCGYKHPSAVEFSPLTHSDVKESLRQMIYVEKLPVYIYGTCGAAGNLFASIYHGWLVDGWRKTNVNNPNEEPLVYLNCRLCMGAAYDIEVLYGTESPFTFRFPVNGTLTSGMNFDEGLAWIEYSLVN